MWIKARLIGAEDNLIPILVNLETIKRISIEALDDKTSTYHNKMVLYFIDRDMNPKTGEEVGFWVNGSADNIIEKLEDLGLLLKKKTDGISTT